MLEDARAPYAILAHHRSGSNFLNDLLQAHPQLECINEPMSMHTPHFRDCDLVPWRREDFDRRWLHASLVPHDGLRDFLFDFKDYLLQSHRGRIVGFKETVLFGKLEWLREFLPPLKVIFLKRDIRAVVSSILRSHLTELWNYSKLVPAAYQRLFPAHHAQRQVDLETGLALPWHTRNPSGDDKVRAAALAAMSVVVRYELARRELRHFEHRILSLEDIVQKPEVCLKVITDFLNVDSDDAPLRFLHGRHVTSRGGLFSSFRSPEDTQHAWSWHLSAAQLRAIDAVTAAVTHATQARPPDG